MEKKHTILIEMEHFETLTIRKPGSWFHGWTIPNFPWTFSENPKEDLAITFETFRAILSDLNEGARVNGDIEKYKAEELYYHFLLHYFPGSQQIPVLRRRHSNPNAIDAQAELLTDDDGSLIWPSLPSIPRRRTALDESSQTVVRNSEPSECFEDPATSQTSTSDMQDSNSDIASLIASLLAPSNPEEDVETQITDTKDILTAQTKEIFDLGSGRNDEDPIPVRINPEFEDYDRNRLKRKSSSDDTPIWPHYYEPGPLRNSKRFKSTSDDNSAREQPVDQEMVDLSSRRRNCTDRTLEVPTHEHIEYALMEANTKMLPEGVDSPTNPFLVLQKQRTKRIPAWLKLAEAVNNARSTLDGDDLELFERLVSTSRPVHEVEELIQKWRDGRLDNFKQLREEASRAFSWRERAEQMDES
ncbi:hypothetical protein NA56DRAFT_723032 [Hyaloscypha hepaticicola]|uniref:Uncharacterized protein n=1 Tax=Hyaloscypha hepaticicola TaxID=2082293 RepID=A0A2J6Q281_9HELO|nr:hypothetical protein NA56DRAFT_723032 [Hyaloscypha hepaticicola]